MEGLVRREWVEGVGMHHASYELREATGTRIELPVIARIKRVLGLNEGMGQGAERLEGDVMRKKNI